MSVNVCQLLAIGQKREGHFLVLLLHHMQKDLSFRPVTVWETVGSQTGVMLSPCGVSSTSAPRLTVGTTVLASPEPQAALTNGIQLIKC